MFAQISTENKQSVDKPAWTKAGATQLTQTTKVKPMKKIISFMHISLDGYVAGPHGEMNWIKVDEELFDHIGQRIAETDTALYGRVTYQMMEGYWPTAADKPTASKHDREHAAWYSKSQKVVLSKTLKGEGLPSTKIIGDNIQEQLLELKHSAYANGKEILLFGSPTATHALHQLDIIDGYWLFVNPVILGQGIPLFVGIKEKVELTLLSSKQFSNGVQELRYQVSR